MTLKELFVNVLKIFIATGNFFAIVQAILRFIVMDYMESVF